MHAVTWLVLMDTRLDVRAVTSASLGTYWFSLLAFAVGVLAGFQALHNRYPQESPALAVRPLGLTYLGLRGAAPASVFCLSLGQATAPPWAWALALGVSTELVLRLKFFIKERSNADGSVEPILAGPFDLLKWYQDFFLSKLGVDLGDIQLKAVKKLIPKNFSFDELCKRITDRLEIVQDLAVRQKVSEAVKAQQRAFARDTTADASVKEARFKDRLGFGLMAAAERRLIRQLVQG